MEDDAGRHCVPEQLVYITWLGVGLEH